MKKLLVLLATISLSAAALAADGPGSGRGNGDGQGGGSTSQHRRSYSPSKGHPVLARLQFSEDSARKVDEIYEEYNQKFGQAIRDARGQGTPSNPNAFREKQQEIYAERDKKIREALPAELRDKFDAGMKIYNEIAAKQRELQDELNRRLDAEVGRPQATAGSGGRTTVVTPLGQGRPEGRDDPGSPAKPAPPNGGLTIPEF